MHNINLTSLLAATTGRNISFRKASERPWEELEHEVTKHIHIYPGKLLSVISFYWNSAYRYDRIYRTVHDWWRNAK